MIAAFLSWWGLFDRRESDPIEDGEEARQAKLLPNYAARDATADEQHEKWNEAIEQLMDGQELDAWPGEHYPDCAPSCRSDHSLDVDDPDYDEESEGAEYDPVFN